MEGPAAPAAQSRYLHRWLPWGPGAGDPAGLLDYLDAVAGRIGRRAVLVPMDDASALFVGTHAARLRRRFAFPAQRPDLIESLADKATLARICRRYGIAHPPTSLPRSTGDVDAAVRSLGLPLVAKWARPWRLPPGRRSTMLVWNAAQAQRLFAAAGPDNPLLLQRRIPPSAGSDWFFQGYFDASSNCLMGGTGRKDLASPPQAGHTVLGEWAVNPEVATAARRLLTSLGYTGVVDLDFRQDAGTGACHLLDVNPRLGAQFRLFADRHGLDLVRAMHMDLSGRRVPAVAPRLGRTFLVENYYARPSVRGSAGPAAGLRAVRRADEFAWYSKDDPAPFVAVGARSAAAAVKRLGGRASSIRQRTGDNR